jgi:hypothetical protein
VLLLLALLLYRLLAPEQHLLLLLLRPMPLLILVRRGLLRLQLRCGLCLMLLHELPGILLLPPTVSFSLRLLLLQYPLPVLLRLLERRLLERRRTCPLLERRRRHSGRRHCCRHLGLQLRELLRDPLGVVVPGGRVPPLHRLELRRDMVQLCLTSSVIAPRRHELLELLLDLEDNLRPVGLDLRAPDVFHATLGRQPRESEVCDSVLP